MGDKGRTRRGYPRRRWGLTKRCFFIVNGKAFFRNNLPRTPSFYVRSANEEGEVNGEFKLIHYPELRFIDALQLLLYTMFMKRGDVLRELKSLGGGICGKAENTRYEQTEPSRLRCRAIGKLRKAPREIF